MDAHLVPFGARGWEPSRLARIAFVLALVNFFAFVIFSLCIGGDAINGHVSGGRYFVASHGRIREVSRMTWELNRAHAISVFITHPLAFVTAFLDYFRGYPSRDG